MQFNILSQIRAAGKIFEVKQERNKTVNKKLSKAEVCFNNPVSTDFLDNVLKGTCADCTETHQVTKPTCANSTRK